MSLTSDQPRGTHLPPVALNAQGRTAQLRQSARWALRLLMRSRLLILACLAIGLLPAALYVQQATPLFTSEAQLVVQAASTNDVLRDRTGPSNQIMNDSVMATEVRVVASRGMAQRVADELGLERDPEFNPRLREASSGIQIIGLLNPLRWLPRPSRDGGEDRDNAEARASIQRAAIVDGILARLRVTSDRRSFVISIRFTSESPEKAARIANAFAAAYVRERLEVGFEDARRISNWLGERLEALRQDVAAAEGAVERFRSESGLRQTRGGQATVNDQQLSELNSRLVIARAELAQRQARFNQVRTLGRGAGNETAADVLQSPLIQRLREQEAMRSRELSEAMQTFGDRHPRSIGLRADLGDLRGRIRQETDRIIASLANEVEATTSGVQALERELAGLRQRTDTAGEGTVRLRELERQADASRTLYETFLARFRREGEQQQMALPNARIVSPAAIPLRPSSPRAPRIYVAAFLLSAVGALVLVFLLDRLDNAVRSADEAEEVAELPVFAILPRLRGRDVNAVREIGERPRSALADSLRGLANALPPLGEGGRVILVTSSEPGEGKSFTSAGLAMTFARGGEKVLLIDADTCRPRLHSVFSTPNTRGLAQVLAGESTAADAAQALDLPGLHFMPAGGSGDASAVLRPERVSAMLQELGGRYDRIVLDTPPVLAVADARVLAPAADRIIFLVKWNATSRDAVRNSIKLLRGNGSTPAGIVLTQVDRRRHARYGYGDYGQYYGQYAEYYAR